MVKVSGSMCLLRILCRKSSRKKGAREVRADIIE